MLLHPEAALAIIRDHSRQSYLFAFRCDPMTALGRHVCGKCRLGDITPLAMLFSRSHRHHLTIPYTHTRGQQYEHHPGQYCSFFSFYLHTLPFAETLFLIVIMEIDHLEFILLPKNPQQPHKVSKRNLVNGERFNAIFF